MNNTLIDHATYSGHESAPNDDRLTALILVRLNEIIAFVDLMDDQGDRIVEGLIGGYPNPEADDENKKDTPNGILNEIAYNLDELNGKLVRVKSHLARLDRV